MADKISGKITNTTKELSGSVAAGGGVKDHERLINRDKPNQHPIDAITDLRKELNSKLDSETALPLIEEATKGKAKGLYFDAKKELARKAFWYLTSDVDPVTGMGTKESIISGPYDLGAGGGGGGGGGSTTTVKISVAIDPETGEKMWPQNVAVGSKCIIGINWSSLRDTEPTGRGDVYVYVDGKLVVNGKYNQGIVTFDLTQFIVAGNNKIEVRVVDAYSTVKNLIGSVNGVTLRLTSNFEDDISYTGDVTFTYTPIGSIRKTIYFIVDGIPCGAPEVTEKTNEQLTRLLPKAVLTHGSHTLRVYFEAELDGETVRSNELFYDLICYEAGNNTPIIASPFDASVEQEQYVSFNVRYRVYTPGKNTSTVILQIDGVDQEPITVGTGFQNWENRFDNVGSHTLKIKTGTVEKTFIIYVHETTIHVEPVTAALALSLSAYGRSNTEAIDKRTKWDDLDHNISGTLTGFNWVSNGWLLDENNNTVLRVSGDARVEIDYKPFEKDCTVTGKTFEFEIATRDIKDFESRIIECLDGTDSITYSQGYAGEDTRQLRFIVANVDNEKFAAKVTGVHGNYLFVFDGTDWDLDNTKVTFEQLEDEYGISLEEIGSSHDETSHYLAGDRISIYYAVAGKGFYLTSQLARLQSQQSALSTQYKEGDRVRLSFVVEKRTEGTETFRTRLIYMYINGILSGVSRYVEGDTFKQTPPSIIKIGSNDSTVDIYNLKIYDNNLTRQQIVNNWIADINDPVEKARLYKHNDNYDDSGNITVEKIAALGDLPYMTLIGPDLPAYKKDRKYMQVDYVNLADPDRDFTAENARVDVQGTSSQYYFRKNFKIKFEGGFYDDNGNWSEHYKMRGDDSKKEKTFTFKADVASSEGTNNVELVRYFEDTKNWFSPPELLPDEDIPGSTDSKKRIRVGIDGFPIVMFHNDGEKTYFYGKMNFNNDKDNKRTFGFKDGDECWEFINNTTPLVLFKTNDLADWASSFESRYPEEYGDDEHPYGTGAGELDKLQELLDWIIQTKRLDTDSEEEKARKLNKFKTEFTLHFNKNSTLYYYLFTELFLMVDSRAKNAMLCYYKSRQAGDGGNRWFWLPYDMDTALGINNEGLLVFNYDKEDTDLQEGAYIYNGQDSVFWNNVRDAFQPELKAMYEQLRSNGAGDGAPVWSFDTIEKYYQDHQAKWSESIFNEDAYTKYLYPYIYNQDATYLGMAQGSKAEQRRWWLANRFRYMDSKYLTGDAKGTTLMLRAYAKSNFEVVPYINCYVTGVFDQAIDDLTVTHRAEKDVKTVIEAPEHWDPAGVDSVVILYSADLLKDVGDLSLFQPGYADFSKAIKLQRLVIGNKTVQNEKLRGLNVGANNLLTYLDARNCPNLGIAGQSGTAEATPTIDLSKCISIEEVHFENTAIKGCIFPTGGNLKEVHLPNTLTSLAIRNHPNLEVFELGDPNATLDLSNLKSLWLEDIPSSVINSYNYVMAMAATSSIRLIGIDEVYSSSAQIKQFYDKLDTLTGLDEKGDNVAKAQITGVIHVNEITYADLVSFETRYPEVRIDAEIVRCLVTFYNDGEFYNSAWVIQNNYLTKVILDPTKESSISTDYTFSRWDVWNRETLITTDLDVNAVYTESVRQYTINFIKQYDQAVFAPGYGPVEIVDWNTLATSQQLVWNDPSVTFINWFTEAIAGEEFNFSRPIDRDYTLYAHWQDSSLPTVSASAASYNLIAISAHDNVGISGYQVQLNQDEPDENAWVDVIPAVENFNTNYEIDNYGTYYIFVKDNNDNVQSTSINSYQLTTNTVPGVLNYHILYNDEVDLTNFILAGQEFKITANFDSHYENTEISVNDIPYTYDTSVAVWEDKIIDILCTPKKYRVQFNNGSKGTKPSDQLITYKTLVEHPGAQYDKGYIIEAWYKDQTFTTIWDFAIKTVEAEDLDVNETVQLYAKWVEYTMPTRLTVVIPEQWPHSQAEITDPYEYISDYYDYRAGTSYGDLIPDKTIYMAFSIIPDSTHYNRVIIDFGDGSPQETYQDVGGILHVTHEYAEAGTYIIEVYGRGEYRFSDNFNSKTVNPSRCLVDVDLAWDVSYLDSYAFMATKLDHVVMTDYLTRLGDGVFANCPYITTVNIPQNIKSFGGQVFSACKNLVSATFNSKIGSIGNATFRECSKLTNVILPNGIKRIGDECFRACTSLIAISLPDTLETIGASCFENSGITSIIIPSTVTLIGTTFTGYIQGRAFANCYNLEKVIMNTDNVIIGSSIWDNCPKLLTAGPIGSECNIEFAWTEKIPDYGLSGSNDYNYLNRITLPNTIKEIGQGALWGAKISEINLPLGLEKIGEDAFTATRITSISVPNRVTYIGDSFCRNCRFLNRIDLYCAGSLNQPAVNTKAWFSGVYKEQAGSDPKLHILEYLDTPEEILEAFGPYLTVCGPTSDDNLTCVSDLQL